MRDRTRAMAIRKLLLLGLRDALGLVELASP